ncbi:MAG TPA: VOC family protein, partial [Deltaproteobacteria bacterium]|nr:VOC family protein [Deltaproteobacteria bacterium]
MIERIDHVSLAVRDIDGASRFFTDILGAVPGASAADDRLGYSWRIFSLGDLSRFEIIAPTGRQSFLENFLKGRNGGIHHITLQTPDIAAARRFLEEKGVPYFGYAEYGDLWKELFIHPKDAFGVLVQIAEFNADDWLAPSVRMPGTGKVSVARERDGVTLTLRHPGGGTAKAFLNAGEARSLLEELDKALA